ncbi:hypothetical protein ACWOC1_03990 [Enterococcus quebecensis]|uniref:Uncharacterized protein n=1 Tax=Enterococcus quebecensis TaxID=903983 RepID=A0A1E5GX09_9ENTE|nr:hypothetical protein [Enterococcus quebecensis]OEG17203.1 hypothetical protein BCR23_04150 [Enterococcus quebecensis]OJG75595.1 hypothetical protein RV12_GL001398 [Enterococcus quebecensis]
MKKRNIYLILLLIVIVSIGTLTVYNSKNNTSKVQSEENSTSDSKKKESSLKFPLDKNKPPFKDLKKEWDSMDFDRYFLMGAQQAWEAWPYAGKVWQGADYTNYGYGLANETYTWIAYPDKTIEKIYTKDLPDDIRTQIEVPVLFMDETYNGKAFAATVEKENYFDQPYQDTQFESLPKSTVHFAISTHELFHGFQGSWALKKNEYANVMDSDFLEKTNKSAANKEARKIRANLMNSLRKAILLPEKEKEYLDEAKYWHTKYKTEQSEDADFVRGTDLYEGSARYFDDAMSVRSVLGVDASKDEIFKAYQKMVKLDFTEEKDLSGPDESYELGGFTGMLLEKHNDNLDWQKRVEKGELLLDVLLEDYEAKLPEE